MLQGNLPLWLESAILFMSDRESEHRSWLLRFVSRLRLGVVKTGGVDVSVVLVFSLLVSAEENNEDDTCNLTSSPLVVPISSPGEADLKLTEDIGDLDWRRAEENLFSGENACRELDRIADTGDLALSSLLKLLNLVEFVTAK